MGRDDPVAFEAGSRERSGDGWSGVVECHQDVRMSQVVAVACAMRRILDDFLHGKESGAR